MCMTYSLVDCCIPFHLPPDSKADKINYHHYTEGIVYSPYDAGHPLGFSSR